MKNSNQYFLSYNNNTKQQGFSTLDSTMKSFDKKINKNKTKQKYIIKISNVDLQYLSNNTLFCIFKLYLVTLFYNFFLTIKKKCSNDFVKNIDIFSKNHQQYQNLS